MEGSTPLSSGAVPRAPSPDRQIWVDCARGFSILIVVLSHTYRGLARSRLPIDPTSYDFFERLTTCFRMPLFFLLSGLFLERAVRKSPRAFTRDKLAAIAWPYLLWSLLQGGVNLVLAPYTNTDLKFTDLVPGILYQPYAQFWFLYVLLWGSFLYYLLRRVGLGVPAVCLVGLGLQALFFVHPINFGGDIADVDEFMLNFFYLAMGGLLSGRLLARVPGTPAPALLATIGAATVALLWATWAGRERHPALAAPLALAGTAGILALSELTTRTRVPAWFFSRCGVMSLQILVAHVLALAGARIFLQRFLHVENIAIHLTVGMAAGVCFPLALAYAARWTGADWLFSLRSRVRRQPAATGVPNADLPVETGPREADRQSVEVFRPSLTRAERRARCHRLTPGTR